MELLQTNGLFVSQNVDIIIYYQWRSCGKNTWPPGRRSPEVRLEKNRRPSLPAARERAARREEPRGSAKLPHVRAQRLTWDGEKVEILHACLHITGALALELWKYLQGGLQYVIILDFNLLVYIFVFFLCQKCVLHINFTTP